MNNLLSRTLLALSLLFSGFPAARAELLLTGVGVSSVVACCTATIVITGTGTGKWVVPQNWNNSNNQIEVIASGAGGDTAGGAGAGAGYSKAVNQTLTAGATVSFSVSAGGAAGVTGSDAWFCNSTSNCVTIAGSAVLAGAKGGGAPSTTTCGLDGSILADQGHGVAFWDQPLLGLQGTCAKSIGYHSQVVQGSPHSVV